MSHVIFLVSSLRDDGPIKQLSYIIREAKKTSGIKVSIFVIKDEYSPFVLQELVADSVDVCFIGGGILAQVFGIARLRRSLINTTSMTHTWGLRSEILAFLFRFPNRIVSVRNELDVALSDHLPPVLCRSASLLYKNLILNNSSVVFCSHALRDRYKLRRESIVIYNGIDETEITALNNPTIRTGRLRVLILSRLIKSKNVGEVLRYFARLPPADVQVSVYGSGPLLFKLRKDFGKYTHITFFGQTPRQNIDFSNFDLYISSSINEGFPNAVLEAAQSGLACFLFDFAQHREILRMLYGDDAKYFLFDDYDDLHVKMENFRKMDCSKYHAVIRTAQLFVSRHLTSQIMAKKYLNLYTRV